MARRRLTQAEQNSRRRNSEMERLAGMMNYVDSGKCDHMFANAETKAYFLADLEAEMIALINAEVDAFPGLYQRNPDGTISLVSDSERKVIAVSSMKPR
jgi:hypothetical protein